MYTYLHSAKRRLRYDPGKIVTHGPKLHTSKKDIFLNYD